MVLITRSSTSVFGCFFVTILSAFQIYSTVGDLPTGCETSFDNEYGGTKVDCTGAGLNSSDIKYSITNASTTSLILSNNQLFVLENDSFKGVLNLVSLSLINCSLLSIKLHSFRGLSKLEVLDLSQNELQFGEDYLPFHVFDNVPNLKQLVLSGNRYSASNGTYADYLNIFDSLSYISSLFIDSFTNLYIGNEFAKLRMLQSIQISCDELEIVHNNSLEGLRFSTIKNLTLIGGIKIVYSNFDPNVFEPLPDFMDLLQIHRIYIGNNRILESMKGLQGKTIRSLILSHLSQNSFTESSAQGRYLDSYIEAEETQYLSQVCVVKFTYTYCRIVGMEMSGLMTGPWKNCIKYIDMSGNSVLVGDMVEFYMLVALRHLEEVTYSTENYPKTSPKFYDESLDAFLSTDGQRHVIYNYNNHGIRSLSEGRIWINDRDIESHSGSMHETSYLSASKQSPISAQKGPPQILQPLLRALHPAPTIPSLDKDEFAHIVNSTLLLNITQAKYSGQQRSGIFDPNVSKAKQIIRLPKNLKIIRIDNLYNLAYDNDIIFKTPNVLQEVYMRYSYKNIIFHGRLNGLDSLTHLDFTGSHLHMSNNVFDNLPNLKSLIMKNTQSSPEFLHNNLARIIRFNNKLEYLDISHNGMNVFPPETFKHNPNIRYLCLAFNRFSHVPFHIHLAPNLEILDLRSNSITSLSTKEMGLFDTHQKTVSNLTIFLHGNAILCTCLTFDFISWMNSRTLLQFDNGANYSCSLENGLATFTLNMNNVDVQRRRCEGQFYFMLSLILASALATVYLSIFLGSRYKTLIVSKVLRVIVPGFIKVLSRKDFTYDVFVGYTDRDVMYVRTKLLPFLEDKWNLRTFIHHRDLRQDKLRMTKVLRNSWRCILLITKSYLEGKDMEHHVMMSACLFVTPCNPKKIVVLVERSVRHDIPDYVLDVVKEEDIIVLPNLEDSLSNQAVLTLTQRLLQQR